ncbi:MAG: alpha-E domain-containing protein, partial [Sulfobacillus sp.]
LFESNFPRSAVGAAANLLRALESLPGHGGLPRIYAGRLYAQLSYDTIDQVLDSSFEPYLWGLVSLFEKVHDSLMDRYFHPEVLEI